MPSPTQSDGLTPMMQQYRRVKHQIPADALLLFRLGDFYEMFFDDAKTVAGLLNLTLTARNGVPMCGIPHHAAEGYIGKLLKHGRKVAICDQLEDAKPGKLVNRDVTQILSPGAHFDGKLLDAHRNNFLAALCSDAGRFGLALIDLTTGDFKVTELRDTEQLANELARVHPAEIIAPTEEIETLKSQISNCPLTPHDGWTFERETAFFALRDHFKTQSLDGFGAADLSVGIGAAGAALHYLQQSLRRNTSHIHRLTVYSVSDFMTLDAVTQRNLELLDSARGDRRHTLVGCVDRTLTPMGARLLREWLTHPLRDVAAIHARQSVVAAFCDEPHVLADFREQLCAIRDMERLLSRLCTGSGNARDLVALKDSLTTLPALKKVLCGSNLPVATGSSLLQELSAQITEQPDLTALIAHAIEDAPPLGLKEGGIIKPGFSAELDELRRASTDGKTWIAALQQQEIERTGVPSLKVRYNSVFGYYIEVTKSNLAKVPSDYIRKQTVANGERFYTPALKEMESKILRNGREYEDESDGQAKESFLSGEREHSA